MAKKDIPIDVKRASDLYVKSYELYKEIQRNYEDFETGNMSYSKDRSKFNQLQKDVSDLKSMASKINTNALIGYVDNESLETIEKNIDFFFETTGYIEKRLLSLKYYKPLLISVKKYIDDMIGMEKYDYKTYAENFDELAKKFTGVLLHPNNIELFKNHIKRMIVGTMSQREFKKIYATNKSKMSKLPKYNFESFKEYKS